MGERFVKKAVVVEAYQRPVAAKHEGEVPDWTSWLPGDFKKACEKLKPEEGYWLVKDASDAIIKVGPQTFAKEYEPKP